MKTRPYHILLFLGLAYPNSAFAQCKESPSQDATLIEKKVLFEDAHHNKKLKEAVTHLNWLLINAPTLNTNLYIKGAEIFNALLQQEKDTPQKQIYFDSLIILYDLRIKNCGDEANVIARKAVSFYNHQANGPRASEMLPIMDKAIALNDDRTPDGLVEAYMPAVKVTSDLKKIKEDDILARYDKITEIINKKIKKAEKENKPVELYKKLLDDNIAILSQLMNLNCDFVRKNLGPKFNANPNDIDAARKIFHFMLKDNCTDDPLWLEAAIAIDAVEKDYGLKKYLAIRYLKTNEYEKASSFFREALALTKVASEKAEMLGYLAFIEEKNGNKGKARDLYRQALAVDPNRKETYEKIGDLYYNSYDECSRKKSQLNDRLVFLIAYDMYEKAGDSKKMMLAKSSFPSIEDVHLLNHERGQKIKVECWINEETTLRTRD